ncbi:rho guanine nucleotide exchange factor 10-like protein [Oppia nitens]|uniref:rho guanine nucleotide exchange factor 10-like protein n=1 Tax=Oppia nitens TaxID=1686743 RepID=UPI0023DCA174|nr:rho guanine nucleotide exchange factor 10-like protein [Oppia nitens]
MMSSSGGGGGANSKAPYYYGELVKKDSTTGATTIVAAGSGGQQSVVIGGGSSNSSVGTNSAIIANAINNNSNNNNNNIITSANNVNHNINLNNNNNNQLSHSSTIADSLTMTANHQTSIISASDDYGYSLGGGRSASRCSQSLSRPSSSSANISSHSLLMSGSQSHYGIANLLAANNNSNGSTNNSYNNNNNMLSASQQITSFANPLLGIEADTRHGGSESLPRNLQPISSKKPNLFQKQSHQKQGIYQRSLSLFANGVSPLLRKKKSKANNNSNNANNNNNSNNCTSATTTTTGGMMATMAGMNSANITDNELLNVVTGTASLARRRRKSEPIMFSYDSITNEISRLQQRQEQILENLNLDFETMLMNDANAGLSLSANNSNHGGSSSLNNISPNSNGNNNNNGVGGGDYGRTIQSSAGTTTYKEPFYMLYEESHRNNRAEDNIYEEIDFLTLSSLRAQYADTLSLQSYKKKGGAKRSMGSSSFTRWFSTRKKSSPTSMNSEDENPYIDIKISKKQRPPICLPEIPPQGLTQEQLKRRYIIGSIVDSENSYINSLQRIIAEYKKPLEESNPTILSQNKINTIFHRLEQILQCHTIFGIALSQCVREWDDKERIGDVFIASFSKSMVLDIYSDFINNFTNAMETARKASKSKSSFAQFLRDKSLSSPDRLSFFGLMVKPVQRFPQFILLLSDLLKHTPGEHPDRMSLQLALTQLESLADRLNERKRDAERHFAVKQLLKDYLSNSTTNSSHRFLLRQDDVYQLDLDASTGLVMKTKCRKLYLLNDMLVCVSVPANRLKFAVSLQDVDVIDDVTPATNNLIANSLLRTKDASAASSPKHCSVERMYCDLNNLIHDLELMSRITNLVSTLRYQYNGLSIELTEQISTEIREEIRRKDAQITLIDKSCLQLRIRSKNYKDIICIQMSDPEVKRDWLIDVRLAKLALDRANNPAWDVVTESISSSTNNINAIVPHRVPLFVKSLPIFATSDGSQLICALHYKHFRGGGGVGGVGADGLALDMDTGVLWICNVNESGSQLGALSTNGADISLIHSYELCDSHVTCIESVGSYSVWIGLRQGRIIVIDANSPAEWQQFAALDVACEVTCIKHYGQYVYVGLINGLVALFNATHYEEPIILTLTQCPVTCLLPINDDVFACSGDKIWIISGVEVTRSYSLQIADDDDEDVCLSIDDQMRPNLLAHCGIGLWVSLVDSSIIKLFHTETFKHLQDLNVASNVKRILNEGSDVIITVTAMLATRGLLWVGTNVGVIVTLTLPRLQGVPLVSGCLNVALHRHIGPVTILLSLSTGAECPNSPQSASNQSNKSNRDTVDTKNEDVESIYGLYSDLLNVGDYVGMRRPSHNITTTKMAWDLSNMNISDDSTSESASSGAIYHDGSQQQRPLSGHQPNSHNANNLVSLTPDEAGGGGNVNNNKRNHIYETGSGGGGGSNLSSRTASTARLTSNIYDCAKSPVPCGSGGVGGGHPQLQQQQLLPPRSARDQMMPIYDTTPPNMVSGVGTVTGGGAGNSKTALLLTGGNGYKRGTLSDTPYSSLHAHCIVWEYKL